MSATLLKSARTTAIAILSASTIAVSPAVTPLPGAHQMLTVKLTEFDAADMFVFENALNSQYYNNLASISIQGVAQQLAIQQYQQETAVSLTQSLLANGYQTDSSGYFYNLTTHYIVDPSLSHVWYYDPATGSLFDTATGEVVTYADPEPIYDPLHIVDFLNNPFGYLEALLRQVMTFFVELVGAVFGGFSASAVDPLDFPVVEAASADSSVVTDVFNFNDVLGGTPDGGTADLGAALSELVPAL